MSNQATIKNDFKGPILLMIASLIWGTAFVAQSVGMDYIGPLTFNAARSYIGCLALLPVMIISGRHMKQIDPKEYVLREQTSRKTLLLGGLVCGVLLCIASLLQQIGIQYTTAGKAGFLTTLYIVLVPIFSIFLGKRPNAKIWVSALIALMGTYFLSMRGGAKISSGDLYVIISALFFSLHIMVVDRTAPRVNGIKLSFIQFFVSATISLVLALIFETPRVSEILTAWQPLIYAGVMSSGVAYTLQILGQRRTNPTAASIIMSMESLFSAISGWIILGETLNSRELFGCALLLAAVILSQLPVNVLKQKNESKPSG